jgi:hypothetical protein
MRVPLSPPTVAGATMARVSGGFRGLPGRWPVTTAECTGPVPARPRGAALDSAGAAWISTGVLDAPTYAAFVAASLALLAVPGPVVLFVLGEAVGAGRAGGARAVVGVAAGDASRWRPRRSASRR